MADNTPIEWTDATWNPVTGCSVVSPGCTNCYAMRLAGTRMKHHASRVGLTEPSKAGPVWNGQLRFNADWLDQPLRWAKPRRIFVCAHGDLFHENVPDAWIDRVFAVMALAPQHTFQVLTKRAARMRDYIGTRAGDWQIKLPEAVPDALVQRLPGGYLGAWPLPNVWLGVSIEDQARADERIPGLLATPAAVRFLSCEPLLGPVDLTAVRWRDEDAEIRANALNGEAWVENSDSAAAYTNADDGNPFLNWVISGGESGPGARGSSRAWFRSLRDQCQAAGVPYFHKQHGEWIDADELLRQVKATGTALYRDDSGTEWRPEPPLTFDQAADLAAACNLPVRPFEHQSDGTTLIRVGKKAAGRLLDGREHNEMPA